MKSIIVSFLLVLVLSCLLFSIVDRTPPYSLPVGIGHIKESGLGLERQEGSIPEIQMTDTSRGAGYMTKIEEKSTDRNAEFPLGANN